MQPHHRFEPNIAPHRPDNSFEIAVIIAFYLKKCYGLVKVDYERIDGFLFSRFFFCSIGMLFL